MALDRCWRGKLAAKFASERRLGTELMVHLPLERRFGTHLTVELALEWRSWAPLNVKFAKKGDSAKTIVLPRKTTIFEVCGLKIDVFLILAGLPQRRISGPLCVANLVQQPVGTAITSFAAHYLLSFRLFELQIGVTPRTLQVPWSNHPRPASHLIVHYPVS